MTTDSGFEHAINIVDSIPADWHVLLWGPLPCTAGSPWQRLNMKHAGARAKIDANIEIFESPILIPRPRQARQIAQGRRHRVRVAQGMRPVEQARGGELDLRVRPQQS